MKNTSKQLKQISNKHTIYCDKNLIKLKKDLNRQFDHVSTQLFRSEYELFLLKKKINYLYEEYDSLFILESPIPNFEERLKTSEINTDKIYDFFNSIPDFKEIDELTKLNNNITELLNSYRERI